jgi:hypothetical protein
LVISGNDIGIPQISAYSMGFMGYHTPNINLPRPEHLADRASTTGCCACRRR